MIVRHFFQDARELFFLDVGCAHYRRGNNTYYLDRVLGWSGLGIDGVAEFGPAYAEYRKRTRFLNYVIVDELRRETRWVRAKKASESHVAPTLPRARRAIGRRPEAGSVTLNALLGYLTRRRWFDGRIDFVSLDINGYELPALRGFDISRYRPALVAVARSGRLDERDLTQYFADAGYELHREYGKYDQRNWYFYDPRRAPGGSASVSGQHGAPRRH